MGKGLVVTLLGGGAMATGVAVAGMVAVARVVGATTTTLVGVTVDGGGVSKFGAIYKKAPNATNEATIHKIVVKLGRRDDKFIVNSCAYSVRLRIFWFNAKNHNRGLEGLKMRCHAGTGVASCI